MSTIILLSTVVGNLILCLLLLVRGWAARLRWLTMMTGLAVILDFLFHFIHDFSHHLYAPLRIFVIYWLSSILYGLVIFEAWRAKIEWLEWLMSVQFLMGVVALFAHQHGDKVAVYRIEIFNCWLNLFGIIWCIVKFRGEPRYEPRT